HLLLSCVLLLALCSVPSSSLFPYTTLFRSEIVAEKLATLSIVICLQFSRQLPVILRNHRLIDRLLSVRKFKVMRGAERYLPSALDRKSTRLNSSHVSISYAVFCLKKKKPT